MQMMDNTYYIESSIYVRRELSLSRRWILMTAHGLLGGARSHGIRGILPFLPSSSRTLTQLIVESDELSLRTANNRFGPSRCDASIPREECTLKFDG